MKLGYEEYLFGNAECPDGDVCGVVGRLKPHVNVVIAGVLIVPITLTLLLYTYTSYRLYTVTTGYSGGDPEGS